MPQEEDCVAKYRDTLYPLYEAFAARLRSVLEELVTEAPIPIAQIEHRAKSPESLLRKLQKKAYPHPLRDIKDLAGVRIITYYLDDVPRVAELVRKEFKLDRKHSSDKVEQLSVDEFGYRSLHQVVSLKRPRSELAEWKTFKTLAAEVQIRSVLQHAWASISHSLDYKVSSQAPAELRRKLFRLSALLELADDEFLSLRNQTSAVVGRYKKELGRGYLDIPLDLASLNEFLSQKVPAKRWYELGLSAGMKPDKEWIDSWLYSEMLLQTLLFVGISNVHEVDAILPVLERTARERLREFVDVAKKKYHDEFVPVPAHIMSILLCIQKAKEMPDAIDRLNLFSDSFVSSVHDITGVDPPARKSGKAQERKRRKGT